RDTEPEAGPFEPAYRLAHLPDRPALEREPAWVEHRLIAAREGTQAVPSVELEPALGGVQDDEAPAALAADRPEVGDQAGHLLGRADRVAGDERAAGHDAVGEEGVPA